MSIRRIKENITVQNKGIALAVVMMVIAVLSIISLCSVRRLLAIVNLDNDSRGFIHAFYAAQSAKAAALKYLSDNPGQTYNLSEVFSLKDTGLLLQAHYFYNVTGVAGTDKMMVEAKSFYPKHPDFAMPGRLIYICRANIYAMGEAGEKYTSQSENFLFEVQRKE